MLYITSASSVLQLAMKLVWLIDQPKNVFDSLINFLGISILILMMTMITPTLYMDVTLSMSDNQNIMDVVEPL